jgi:hypothetical protein
MASRKTPERVNDNLRPKFGIPAILGQSDRVVGAFGQRLGFMLMVLAIFACAGVTGSTVMLFTRLFLR